MTRAGDSFENEDGFGPMDSTQGQFTDRGRNRASGTIGRRTMTQEEGAIPQGSAGLPRQS